MKTPQVIFTLSYQLSQAFLDKSDDLSEILLKEVQSNESKIVELTQHYLTDRFQIYACDDYTLNEMEDRTGSFYVNYSAYQYNGCKDMEGQLEDDICIDFYLDIERGEFVLTGPEVYERSTYEEF